MTAEGEGSLARQGSLWARKRVPSNSANRLLCRQDRSLPPGTPAGCLLHFDSHRMTAISALRSTFTVFAPNSSVPIWSASDSLRGVIERVAIRAQSAESRH
jgi:hypothetical protein